MTTMTPPPQMRPATTADYPGVARLLEDSGLPTAGVAELLQGHAADFLVAEAGDGQLIGAAGLEVCRDDALLRSVAVRPQWRQHGIGRDLVRLLIDEAERRGLRSLYLLTTAAEHYFPRFGFRAIDRSAVPASIAATVEFRSACPASAIVMTRSLAGRGET